MTSTAGYFYALSKNGDYLDEVAPWCNWAHVSDLTTEQAESLPERAKALGLKISLGCMETFFLPAKVYTRRTDWLARWHDDTVAGRSLAKRLSDAGVLHSVYVADEPRGNGLSLASLEPVLAAVGKEFPTFIVEDASGSTPTPPQGVTYYGLTCYTPRTLKDAAARYASLRAKWAGQIIVVAQAFNEIPYKVPDQAAWLDLAGKVPSSGLAWFCWAAYTQGTRKYFGTRDDPAAVAVHKQFGVKFKGEDMTLAIIDGERYFADVNGDGKAELIVRTPDPEGLIQVYSRTKHLGQWSYGYTSGYRLWFADTTGDGKVDLVSEHPDPEIGLQVGMSSGTAFATPVRWGG